MNLVKEAARQATNGNVKALARLIGTSPRTVYGWSMGEAAIPSAAEKLLRLLVDKPEIAELLR